tara:strand:- start:3157 stop:3735 length:579 start_codon:yes stop_codon:yes gene_type:complete
MLMKSPIIRNKQRPITERAHHSQIFIDKIVDPRKEPTLFNIESARMSVTAKTGPFQTVKEMRSSRLGKVRTQQDVISRDTLAQMNIVVSTHTEDFSLLENNSNKPSLKNPRIMDSQDFKDTINDLSVATDKFSYNNDPFYQLDESLRSPRAYTSVSVAGTNNRAPTPDLSHILSNLTIVNQKTTYFGKNKYF